MVTLMMIKPSQTKRATSLLKIGLEKHELDYHGDGCSMIYKDWVGCMKKLQEFSQKEFGSTFCKANDGTLALAITSMVTCNYWPLNGGFSFTGGDHTQLVIRRGFMEKMVEHLDENKIRTDEGMDFSAETTRRATSIPNIQDASHTARPN